MNVASDFLHRLFEALDRVEVEYCLLRGYDELLTPAVMQEIDLLTLRAHRARFEAAVAELGFVAWPAWGHAPHRFYIAYDPAGDCWFKLDVVESLRYGSPVRCLALDLHTALLRRRRRHGPTWILSSEDELLTLLLHCVLDKRDLRPAHRLRLMALWREISGEPETQKRLFATLAQQLGRWPMLAVAQGFDLDDLEDLMRERRRWTRQLFWRQPLLATGRTLGAIGLRRARRLLFACRRHGLGTVLLAPDGGGKSTLAQALARDPWLRARVVYMGGNAAVRAFRLPMRSWIERRRRATRGVSRHFRPLWGLLTAAHTLAEDWCRATIGRLHVLQGRFVVYDRFFYDTYLSPRGNSRRLRLRRWLLQRSCPTPDLVLLLDAPGEVLHRRKGEHTPALLEKQRRALKSLGEHMQHFVVLDTTAGADLVRRRAIAHIWEGVATRWGEAPRVAWRNPESETLDAAPFTAGDRARMIS